MADNKNLSSYLFTVEIDGIETARFQKCEELEAETYVYEIEKREKLYAAYSRFSM